MNSNRNRIIRDTVYARGIKKVINSISRLLGHPINEQTRTELARLSYPTIVGVRRLIANQVYRDYLQTVGTNPVKQFELTRFTPEFWQGSVDNAVKDHDFVTVTVTQEIGMSADYWARDAEWGEGFQLAHADDRIDRIARVDFEPPTCPLCTLMNSRGPVYVSKDSFLRTLHTGDTCEPIFVKVGEKHYPGSEHTAEALRRYEEAVKVVGPHQGANTIMTEMKNQHPYDSPGKVRTWATQASQEAKDKRVKDLQGQNSRLEKLNLASGTNHNHRDNQMTRNTELLTALGAN